ncbi:hypothetical protein E5Q_02011 [Mixia osmundae IAM 14324]|uniref:Uncharacterized protein n=1 Tax=Mixia osmundae (strain CBS 9802 / IAM 14324 / JCM 22182 / KY 12970) TaxID=764103 RepID=G7DXP4_MIXOS|nr:hypothetical protein E5Q_02011 [Mixia osmundae IAM 14324]
MQFEPDDGNLKVIIAKDDGSDYPEEAWRRLTVEFEVTGNPYINPWTAPYRDCCMVKIESAILINIFLGTIQVAPSIPTIICKPFRGDIKDADFPNCPFDYEGIRDATLPAIRQLKWTADLIERAAA